MLALFPHPSALPSLLSIQCWNSPSQLCCMFSSNFCLIIPFSCVCCGSCVVIWIETNYRFKKHQWRGCARPTMSLRWTGCSRGQPSRSRTATPLSSTSRTKLNTMSPFTGMYIYINTCAHIHAHIHVYIHMHMCIWMHKYWACRQYSLWIIAYWMHKLFHLFLHIKGSYCVVVAYTS